MTARAPLARRLSRGAAVRRTRSCATEHAAPTRARRRRSRRHALSADGGAARLLAARPVRCSDVTAGRSVVAFPVCPTAGGPRLGDRQPRRRWTTRIIVLPGAAPVTPWTLPVCPPSELFDRSFRNRCGPPGAGPAAVCACVFARQCGPAGLPHPCRKWRAGARGARVGATRRQPLPMKQRGDSYAASRGAPSPPPGSAPVAQLDRAPDSNLGVRSSNLFGRAIFCRTQIPRHPARQICK